MVVVRVRRGQVHLASTNIIRCAFSSSSPPPSIIQSTEQAPSTTPTNVQAPNRASIWSRRQEARSAAMLGPRFIGINLEAQPRPLAAIELLKKHPIVSVQGRVAVCDGNGPLGHPRVFINLDNPSKPASCGYCGLRFQQEEKHDRH